MFNLGLDFQVSPAFWSLIHCLGSSFDHVSTNPHMFVSWKLLFGIPKKPKPFLNFLSHERFSCAISANLFCFGFGSTRVIGRQQHTSWGGLTGTVQSRLEVVFILKMKKKLWKDTCGICRNASLSPPFTAVAEIGSNPVYLELEDKKLVKGLESRGWCGSELRDASHPWLLVPPPCTWLRSFNAVYLPCSLILVVLWGQLVP